LTSNDDLLLLNQLEAGRSVLRTNGHLRADDADYVDALVPPSLTPHGRSTTACTVRRYACGAAECGT